MDTDDRRAISDCVDRLQRGLYALQAEVGGLDYRIVQHDNYNYSINFAGKKIVIKMEIENG